MEIGYGKMKMGLRTKILYAILFGLPYVLVSVSLDTVLGNSLENIPRLVIRGLLIGLIVSFTISLISNKLDRKMTRNVVPKLNDNEKIEIEGPANLYKGVEGVGGKMFLTNQRMIFKSHNYNIQTGQTNIPFMDIEDVIERKLFLIADVGLRVKLKGRKKYDFVVNERNKWIEEINSKLK